MRKSVLFVLIPVLLIMLIIPSFAFEKENNAGKSQISTQYAENHMKILVNALELYANDHYRDYPNEKEFFSTKLFKYIQKTLGNNKANAKLYYLCAPGEKIKYKRFEKTQSYKIWCDNPQKFGLKEFSFSPEKGLVKNNQKSAPGEAKTGETAETEANWEPASQDDKKEMTEVIKSLYQAYKDKNLEKVMEIEKEAIVRSGLDMEKRGLYTAIEVYYAFKGTKNDVFRAEGFEMEPLDLKNVHFRKRGKTYQAYALKPIIATKQVTVGAMKVRLRIGVIDFEKTDGVFRPVKMKLY